MENGEWKMKDTKRRLSGCVIRLSVCHFCLLLENQQTGTEVTELKGSSGRCRPPRKFYGFNPSVASREAQRRVRSARA